MFDWLIDWVYNTVNSIYDWALSWFNYLKSWALSTFARIGDIVQYVTNYVTETYQTIVNNITQVYQTVTNYVTEVYQTVTNYVTEVYQTVTNYVTETYQTIVNNITQVIGVTIEKVGEWFVSIGGATKEWVEGLFVQAQNNLDTNWAQFKLSWQADISQINETFGWVNDFRDNITEFFSDPFGWIQSYVIEPIVDNFNRGFDRGMKGEDEK